ncbi:MAG: hypothetical protein KGQ38_06865, partial [Actinomycetales bacterium]|nr:hypothetical protein [Actinomycetales bacterium]
KLRIISKYNRQCDTHREASFQFVEQSKPDLLIISDNLNSDDGVAKFKSAYDEVVPRLKASTKQLLLIETSATTSKLLDCLNGGTDLTNCPAKPFRVTQLRAAQREIAQKYGIGYWDTSSALCFDQGNGLMCPPVIGKSAVSGDGGHIFPNISKELAPFLMKVLIALKVKDLAPLD